MAAAGTVALFFMQFQPWMFSANWNASATVNAFGTITTTTAHLTLWSQTPVPGAQVSGAWALLTSVAVFVTVCAAFQAIRRDSAAASTATALAATAVAVLTLANVFYFNSKMHEVLVSLGSANDLGMQLGLVVGALRGGSYPWPGQKTLLNPTHLTWWAFASPGVAFTSAAVALIRSWRGGLPQGVIAVRRRVARQIAATRSE